MNANSISMQDYWFPGSANQRAIFDFTNGVLEIESPGFPLVPEDSVNFGNVITLSDNLGYYIIGKYLVDSNFTVVAGSDAIFNNANADVANCAFAPVVNESNAAHLYFIDNAGLHYGHISQNVFRHSTLDALTLVPLTFAPAENSPLCILGDADGNGNWLFYFTVQDALFKLVTVYCEAAVERSSTLLSAPDTELPVSMDIHKNKIALVYESGRLVYGSLTAAGETMNVTLDGSITGLSAVFIQSAFSADSHSLFWITNDAGVHNLNHLNMITGKITTTAVSGNYKALKRGPDDVIYGLSFKTQRSSTLLIVTPNNLANDFSVSEIFTPANGGYFPATAWNVYTSS